MQKLQRNLKAKFYTNNGSFLCHKGLVKDNEVI